jgi:hypothetical protein
LAAVRRPPQGRWEKIDQAEAAAGAVVVCGRIWRPGLQFEDFVAGRLDLETSKNEGRALFDVIAYPLCQQALAAVPATDRVGLLVTDESGRPVTRRYWQRQHDAQALHRAVGRDCHFPLNRRLSDWDSRVFTRLLGVARCP